jgi:hypothetical protein
MALFARAVAVQDQACGPSDTHVAPPTFLEFCDKYGVPLPAELRAIAQKPASMHEFTLSPVGLALQVSTGVGHNAETEPQALRQPENRYRSFALRVAQDLKEAQVRHVTAPMLKAFIESWFAEDDSTVLHRAFQTYLDKWRRSDAKDRVLKAYCSRFSSSRAADLAKRT